MFGFRKSKGDTKLIEAVGDHIEKHIGPIALVMDEIDSPLVHVDVYFVKATAKRPYHTFVTSGMSEKAMPVPNGALDGRYAEVMICLPAAWPVSMEAFQDENNWWPIQLLKDVARFPHQHKTWVCEGHTISNGDRSEPYAPNTSMTNALLLKPSTIDRDGHIIHIDEKRRARLWAIYPIYEEELELKLEGNSMDLAVLFSQNGVSEVLDPKRKNVALG